MTTTRVPPRGARSRTSAAATATSSLSCRTHRARPCTWRKTAPSAWTMCFARANAVARTSHRGTSTAGLRSGLASKTRITNQATTACRVPMLTCCRSLLFWLLRLGPFFSKNSSPPPPRPGPLPPFTIFPPPSPLFSRGSHFFHFFHFSGMPPGHGNESGFLLHPVHGTSTSFRTSGARPSLPPPLTVNNSTSSACRVHFSSPLLRGAKCV